MKLPPFLLHSQYFVFSRREELERALDGLVSDDELQELRRLSDLGLPPITSELTLATMLGVNSGLIWSFINRPAKHYDEFQIPKGKGRRRITAPRVALKVVQKWLSVQLGKCYTPPDHVFGFVPGRSHILAAMKHVGCSWVLSVDIKDFFPSVSAEQIRKCLEEFGYSSAAANIISSLTCFNDSLPQGAPTSPVLSNMVFREADFALVQLAGKYEANISRYADDIVYSSRDVFHGDLYDELMVLFRGLPWELASDKTELTIAPSRRKVHGLLVGGEEVRLTKGYRNRLRAYRHLLQMGKVRDEDIARIQGHVMFGEYVREVVSARP